MPPAEPGSPSARSRDRSPRPDDAPPRLGDAVAVGLFRTRPDGTFADANDACARLLGFARREDLLGVDAKSLHVDPDTRERWRERLEREGEVRGFECELRRQDGRRFWARTTSVAVRDATGAPAWFEGVLEDVTDQKRAEGEVARRLAFERTLAQVSSRFASETDLDAAIRAGLADMARLTGAGRAYVFLLQPDGQRMDNTHEWCAPAVEPHIDELQGLPVEDFAWWMSHLRKGEAVHVRDVSALPPEASNERTVLESQGIKSALAFPVHAAGTLAGFIGFDNVERAQEWGRDDLRLLHVASGILGNVLERQQAQAALRISETRFRLLVDQSPLSTQIVAPDGRIVRVNPAWERLWGVTLDQIKDFNVRHDPQMEERGIAPYVERAFAGEAIVTPPVEFRPDRGVHAGSSRWVRAVMYPVTSESGELREVVIIQEDMTETLRAQRELETSRHQLALSEKLAALGALVSGVAHEIRTPLTYVSNNVVLLERAAARAQEEGQSGEALATAVREHAKAMQEGIDRIRELVSDLRGYAKLRGGQREEADLAEVVRVAVELFRATHRGAVAVDARLEESLTVQVDREQVQQVVLNLLTNAAEAMQSRGEVRVRLRRVPEGAELVVEDAGPGLAPDVEPHIFEPFFTTKREGTGLGLSISKRLVEAHGGAIRHEPVETGGARFIVRLPMPR